MPWPSRENLHLLWLHRKKDALASLHHYHVLLGPRRPASFYPAEAVKDCLLELSVLQHGDKYAKVGCVYQFCLPWEEEEGGKDEAEGLLFQSARVI